MDLSVVIPVAPNSPEPALALAEEAATRARQVIVAGAEPGAAALPKNVEFAPGDGRGLAIRAALERVTAPITVLHAPEPAYRVEDYAALAQPIRSDTADVVVGRARTGGPGALAGRALSRIAQLATDVPLRDPSSGFIALRTESARSVSLSSEDEAVSAELLVKLSAQLFRFQEVELEGTGRRAGLAKTVRQARTFLRYATVANDADNLHEGYNTLLRMEGAPNYNAWIGRRMRPYLGKRVLEIGAGIGTITREIEEGRELVIALEVDRFYVDRLKNLFRGKPHVRPYLSDVALADWEALRAERLDTIVLSNVLEHVKDDTAALVRLHQILEPGGRLLILVPALEALRGSIDDAVGHFRRYGRAELEKKIRAAGFELERSEWMNLLGIPGWFVNSRVLRRRAVPPLQLKVYDQLAPYLAQLESRVPLPIGMSLFAVARATGNTP